MEKNKGLHQLSTEELLKSKKSISVLTSILLGMLTLLLGLTTYTWIINGSSPLLAVPLALSPIVLMNYKKIGAIKKELKSREQHFNS
ncbi:redox-active disulfide protein 2 [Sphingobacterium suaedae]|uniref:Redox-active disulfide protein 2 n=1 Tax=Sphingobacterium suaedae TaxID=1686402 RepID=A0ABW5KEK0_9SPHI